MGKVRTGLAVSLDGFISGPNDGAEAPMGVGGERLVAWYAGGDTEYRLPGTDMVFRVSAQTAAFLRQTRETTGALVFGRRTFDLTNGWGGNHPLDVPVFVVTSSVPQAWVYEGSPFTFVTDGLESALEQAQAVAGDKDVGVGAASICSSASERDSSTRSTSTWCPCCSEAASHCSTTSARGRSTWSARG
jgi:dihydrofolate reductase